MIIVKVYFSDGNSINWYADDDPDLNTIKVWCEAVVNDSYAWASAALHGRDEWTYNEHTLPYHPTIMLPDDEYEITTLDVEAVYVVDDDGYGDENIIMYYIHSNADRNRCMSEHWRNRGRLVDLRCPLVKMVLEYENDLAVNN